jgi:broad specificity phosphatase PhoE
MGRLFLVRHAQASFLAQDYDKLSPLGESQARLLGEYWSRRRFVFDRVGCGPANRHAQTARIVAEVFKKDGLDFPEPSVIPEFDEFQAEAVMDDIVPRLVEENEEIRRLHDAFHQSGSKAERHSRFQRLFEAAIAKWVNGEIAVNNVESWQEFCVRVNTGLTDFLANATKGEVAAIFTSGGPIGVAVQRALHLSAMDTLRTAWMSRNCSFSEFLFSGDRLTLSSFNAFPHLDDEAQLTYR